MEDKEIHLEVTTPPEDVASRDDLIQSTPLVMVDRTGLRLSFYGLLPVDTENKSGERFWSATIIMNSSELELPEVNFKLRVAAKKGVNPRITCNKNAGSIKQNTVFMLSYHLPESSIDTAHLTLLVDGSPYEVPIHKSKNVPRLSCKMEQIPVSDSSAQSEHLSDELKSYLSENNGFEQVCKQLYPHAISVFRDLSIQKLDSSKWEKLTDETMNDAIAAEIVKRFHEANRQKYRSTPITFNQSHENLCCDK